MYEIKPGKFTVRVRAIFEQASEHVWLNSSKNGKAYSFDTSPYSQGSQNSSPCPVPKAQHILFIRTFAAPVLVPRLKHPRKFIAKIHHRLIGIRSLLINYAFASCFIERINSQSWWFGSGSPIFFFLGCLPVIQLSLIIFLSLVKFFLSSFSQHAHRAINNCLWNWSFELGNFSNDGSKIVRAAAPVSSSQQNGFCPYFKKAGHLS